MERFDSIYTRHREAVQAYVRRRAPAAQVEDVVSETFLVCWRKLDQVPAQPLPWLYAVARKTLANHRRKSSRDVAQGLEPIVTEEPAPVGDGLLAAAFSSLSERDREVLRLVAWEGLSLREAAVVLDCSPVACRVRYHRAKGRLGARLAVASLQHPDPKGALR